MFNKLKGTVIWLVVLAVPVAVAVFAIKYIMTKHTTDTPTADDIVEDAKEFISKLLNFGKKV